MRKVREAISPNPPPRTIEGPTLDRLEPTFPELSATVRQQVGTTVWLRSLSWRKITKKIWLCFS